MLRCTRPNYDKSYESASKLREYLEEVSGSGILMDVENSDVAIQVDSQSYAADYVRNRCPATYNC